MSEETARFISDNAARPFLAVHAFYQVHTPLNAAPDHIEQARLGAAMLDPDPMLVPRDLRYGAQAKSRQDNAVYASMVAAMDAAVGRIVGQLTSEGLLEETIIVFVSDNGGLSRMGQDPEDAPTSNAPLRGSKGWLYEGGIRVPLVIVAPDRLAGGTTNSRVTTSVDLVPTILALAGIDRPGDLDGIDLNVPDAGADRALYWHFPHYHASGWRPGGAIRDGELKLIEYFEDGDAELFNLAADAFETRDLAAEQPADVARLRHKLHTWRMEMNAFMPRARN